MDNKLEMLLRYQSLDWRLFPYNRATNIPMFKGWQEKASNDPEQITAWHKQLPNAGWRRLIEYPDIAIDMDVKGGKNGIADYDELSSNAPYPITPTALTKNDGIHLNLTIPNDIIFNRKHYFLTEGLELLAPGWGQALPLPDNGRAWSTSPWEVAPVLWPDYIENAWRDKETLVKYEIGPPAKVEGHSLEAIFSGILSATKACKSGGGWYKGHCPAHEDRTPSFSTRLEPDKIITHCFAGCDWLAILDGLGLKPTDMYVPRITLIPNQVFDPVSGEPTTLVTPLIKTNNRSLPNVSGDAMMAIIAANDPPSLFVRGGKLSRVLDDEDGIPCIQRCREPELRGIMTRCADFYYTNAKKKDRKHDPPINVVRDIIAMGQWGGLPGLRGLSELPIIQSDGGYNATPGYDSDSRLFFAPAEEVTVTMPEGDPLLVIDDIIAQFPFVGGSSDSGIGTFEDRKNNASYANALAVMITPVVRPLIEGLVPLAIIDKPQAGTGASLLADVVSIIGTGRYADMTTAPFKDDEWRKSITAKLLAGTTINIFDNVDGQLKSASLSRVLTATKLSDRRLGVTEQLSLINYAVWIVTGNNLRLGADLPRRCYWVRMNAEIAYPWQRDGFKHPNLKAYTKKQRGALLGAIFKIVQNWIAAGRPRAQDVPMMGSFEQWADIVGGILYHAGIRSFLGNMEDLYQLSDDDTPEWETFFLAWEEVFGSKGVTVSQVAENISAAGSELRKVVPSMLSEKLDTKSFNQSLGMYLKGRKDVTFPDGIQLLSVGKRSGIKVWAVRRKDAIKAVAEPEIAEEVEKLEGVLVESTALF